MSRSKTTKKAPAASSKRGENKAKDKSLKHLKIKASPNDEKLREWSALIGSASIVGMWQTISFDHESALSLAHRFCERDNFFLLESAVASSHSGARYTFLGFDALWEMSGPNDKIKAYQPFEAIRSFLEKQSLAAIAIKPDPIANAHVTMGGPFGYFSFDAVANLEPTVGKAPKAELGLPVAHFFLPRNFFVLDHLTQRLTVVRYFFTPQKKGPTLESLCHSELRLHSELIEEVRRPHSLTPLRGERPVLDWQKFESKMQQTEFEALARRCLEEINKGEIFQIQIGNRLSCKTKASAFDIYRRLRSLNPSPYMFFYRLKRHTILGASPEMMVGVNGKRMTHRPIAGTRRRLWNAEEDAKMKAELKASEKERAEHIMLVDLARNDIGRVAAPGSVKVEELMSVEEYSHVFHMVSQVSGQLRQDRDATDALIASFPNGTVCGAPKIRSIQLIYQLEKMAREFYAGCLGVFDFSGNLRSTLLIRTIYVGGGKAYTQASAGIVYDSVPAHEWLETRNKMAACATAMLQVP